MNKAANQKGPMLFGIIILCMVLGGSEAQAAEPGAPVLRAHDVHADFVRARIIYAHDIHADDVRIRVIRGVEGERQGGGGDIHAPVVEADEIDAHDIHARVVEADVVYAHDVHAH